MSFQIGELAMTWNIRNPLTAGREEHSELYFFSITRNIAWSGGNRATGSCFGNETRSSLLSLSALKFSKQEELQTQRLPGARCVMQPGGGQ